MACNILSSYSDAFFSRRTKGVPSGSTVWVPLSNNNFVPLRALKMAVLSYYYFGEKTNDGALTLREKRQSQGSSSYNARRVRVCT